MKLTNYIYTETFCEKNIWHLCQHPDLAAYKKKVLIISNAVRNCPFWHQKSSVGDQPVRWDYHVILLVTYENTQIIYDFDSTLELPSLLDDYIQHTFRTDLPSWEIDKPLFKAIPSEEYISHFKSNHDPASSDSSEDLTFSPPNWPLLKNQDGIPLPAMLDFGVTSEQRVYTFEEVIAKEVL